jgi:hypothetical protein
LHLTTRHREAEIALGARSRHKAEAELKLVDSARFATTITEFIEWRTFAYWVRLVVEIDGAMSSKMQAILNERRPGFIGTLTAHRESHPDERESLWLRLIEWIDHTIFATANAEGWRHAHGFYSARDPRLDRVREYWLQSDDAWKRPPAELPSLDQWRQAAGGTSVALADCARVAGGGRHAEFQQPFHGLGIKPTPLQLVRVLSEKRPQ